VNGTKSGPDQHQQVISEMLSLGEKRSIGSWRES
jgi:hypothetical protein